MDPEPWDMPGYDSQVIMAAGAFVQGSSIELSADGPVKPPVCRVFPGWTYLGTCKTGRTDVFAETGRCEYCDTSVKIEGRIVAVGSR